MRKLILPLLTTAVLVVGFVPSAAQKRCFAQQKTREAVIYLLDYAEADSNVPKNANFFKRRFGNSRSVLRNGDGSIGAVTGAKFPDRIASRVLYYAAADTALKAGNFNEVKVCLDGVSKFYQEDNAPPMSCEP